MNTLALKQAQKNYDSFDELKLAQKRLELARTDYDLGIISRGEYISATEECIEIIHSRSNSYKKP